MALLVQGWKDLSFHQVAGEIVKSVLDRFNHRVEIHSAAHEDVFPALRHGELDLMIGWSKGSHGKPHDLVHGNRP